MDYIRLIVPLVDTIFGMPLLSYYGEFFSIQNILANII